MTRGAWWSLGLLLTLGCNTSLRLEEYRTTCVAASDCVAVALGNVCAPCSACPAFAISVASKAKYDADRGSIAPFCLPSGASCGPCQTGTAACDAGQCAFVPD